MASTSHRSVGFAFCSRLYLHKLWLAHHQEGEMIEMQVLTPTTNRHHPLSISPSDSGHASSSSPSVENHNHNHNHNTGAGFLSSIGSWLTTSSAVVSSVVQDVAEDWEISDSFSSGMQQLSLGASLVAEVSLVAAKAATFQAHSVVDAAVMSILDKTSTSSTRVEIDSCQGRGCRGTCCSTADMITDTDILAAVKDLRV